MATTPRMKISTATTVKVYGRRSASRTIHTRSLDGESHARVSVNEAHLQRRPRTRLAAWRGFAAWRVVEAVLTQAVGRRTSGS
jgi:hypothetical protein